MTLKNRCSGYIQDMDGKYKYYIQVPEDLVDSLKNSYNIINLKKSDGIRIWEKINNDVTDSVNALTESTNISQTSDNTVNGNNAQNNLKGIFYYKGKKGSNKCNESDNLVTTQEECQIASEILQIPSNFATNNNNPGKLQKCFMEETNDATSGNTTNLIHFNTNTTQANDFKNEKQTPICKKIKVGNECNNKKY